MTENATILDQNYWNSRWETGATGWDIGYPAPAIADYMRQETDKKKAILIAGCGNAYEAAFLVEQGFENITLIDIAPEAVARLQTQFGNVSQVKIICGDFFKHVGAYDLAIEQTFFCAISPEKRGDYVQKMSNLLRPNGQIIGLMFGTVFEKAGPPFGGFAEEYQTLFEPLFEIQQMAITPLSIPLRQGTELFVVFEKR